eukprot:scaffold40218_cov66-Cyclotella_meneghiniana.AAC.4
MSSSQTPVASSGAGKGKGKDLSRMMSAPPASAEDSTTSTAPPVTTVNKESPGKKGKDLSRMVASASAAAASKDNDSQDQTSTKPPTPTGKPKGKDLSRMVGASPSPNINVSQFQSSIPESEQQRRQNVARAAADPTAAQLIQTTPPSWAEASLVSVNKSETSKGAPTPQKKYGDPSQAPLLGTKLQALCHSIDPSYTLDSKVQDMLLEMADGFVDKVTQDALKLSKHRGSKTLDVVDVALALKKGYGMEVPGLGSPSAPVPGGSKNNMIGGWLFANKVSVDEKAERKKPRLK